VSEIKQVVAIDGGKREVVFKDGTRMSFEQHRAMSSPATPQTPPPQAQAEVKESPVKSAAEGKRKWSK
jgi:hypothetical protein